jgi:starch synthase
MKKILFTASECVPFIKTGGLADVIGSLPKYFDKSKYDVRVIIPKYTVISKEYKEKMVYLDSFEMGIAEKTQYVGIFTCKYEGIIFYFIDSEYYFSGQGIYEGSPDWNIEKFAFFSKAVLSILPVIDFRPDLIHCNDWQTGLIPVYLDNFRYFGEYYKNIKTIMTIHNLKFQGAWNTKDVQRITELPKYYFTPDKLEAYKDANLLKGGLVYADKITTVSESYANEIKTPFFGEGLDGLMKARSGDLVGIVNGLDVSVFNPELDYRIASNYSVEDFRQKKVKNKLALQEEVGLPKNSKVMLIGMVSRLTGQKGFDLVERVLNEICQENVQLVILGTGEAKYESLFHHFAWKYPKKVSANIFYNERLSHMIYAGCDGFLMPSLFEPCGLSQLMSLRYGTIPIVRETGGLKDTVEPYNEYKRTGTGFGFLNYNAHEMLDTIRYAISVYYDRKRSWNKIVERAMKKDFSWNNSTKQYEVLYDELMGS